MTRNNSTVQFSRKTNQFCRNCFYFCVLIINWFCFAFVLQPVCDERSIESNGWFCFCWNIFEWRSFLWGVQNAELASAQNCQFGKCPKHAQVQIRQIAKQTSSAYDLKMIKIHCITVAEFELTVFRHSNQELTNIRKITQNSNHHKSIQWLEFWERQRQRINKYSRVNTRHLHICVIKQLPTNFRSINFVSNCFSS